MSNARAEIMSAILTKLKTISVRNGYNSEIGKSIYRWHVVPVNGTVALPYCDVRDTSDVHVPWASPNRVLHKLKVIIQLVVSEDTSIDTVIKILCDVDKVLGIDSKLGGKLTNLSSLHSDIQTSQEGNRISGATYTIQVEYVTNSFGGE